MEYFMSHKLVFWVLLKTEDLFLGLHFWVAIGVPYLVYLQLHDP